MNYYERRFYEDIHKLVNIQSKILKELEKMNKPLQEDKELTPINHGKILTQKEIDEERKIMVNEVAKYFCIKRGE